MALNSHQCVFFGCGPKYCWISDDVVQTSRNTDGGQKGNAARLLPLIQVQDA